MSEKLERYWSGGIRPHADKPAVDIFLDGSQISIGAHNGEDRCFMNITDDEALVIINMLKEARVRARQWLQNTPPAVDSESA